MANNVLWNNTFLKPLCQSGVVPTPELSLWQGLHSTFLLLSPDLLLLSPDAWGWFPRWQRPPFTGCSGSVDIGTGPGWKWLHRGRFYPGDPDFKTIDTLKLSMLPNRGVEDLTWSRQVPSAGESGVGNHRLFGGRFSSGVDPDSGEFRGSRLVSELRSLRLINSTVTAKAMAK